MRTDITHLPSKVQTELAHIIRLLGRHDKPVSGTGPGQYPRPGRVRHLILHGCFTEDHWQPETELCPNEISYRYNIMVIISRNQPDIFRFLDDIETKLNQSGKVSFPVSLYISTQGKLNRKLENGYLAYDQIQTRGILLYSRWKPDHDLFQPPDHLSAGKHYIQARDYFDHAFSLAQLFLSGGRAFEGEDRNAAAFMLNLAAIQAYAALMTVHVLKYSDRQGIYELRELAESIHPELGIVWTGLRGEQIFELLTSAFRNVRFSTDYRITDIDLNLMFGYVKDLHKLVHHICQIKFETLKSGSLEKPNKDWLEIVREALKPPEDSMFADEEEEPELQKATIPDPPPVIRTAEQEEAMEKLSDAIFEIEEPCYDLEVLGDVLKCMAWDDDADESRGIELLGRYVQDQATVVKSIFRQMCVLLKEIPLRKDAPAKEECDATKCD